MTTGAAAPLAPGTLLGIESGPLQVDIAPDAGGRLAQIRRHRVEHLLGYGPGNAAMIAWGCYPMAPWAGRLRQGGFEFEGHRYRLPCNFGGHAIHGVAFGLPWRVDSKTRSRVELSLQLPQDQRWPFGGHCRQRIEVGDDVLRMTLALTAGARAMPAAIGWHPWLRKPDRLGFAPTSMYPRDAAGIATTPLVPPSPGPWDDCFVNRAPVQVDLAGTRLRLTSDCSHWVVYDRAAHATCIEPQSGPPDGFNLAPETLAPGATMERWFLFEWS